MATNKANAELERLAAEQGVVRTIFAYCHALDSGDVERWLDCFTDGAVWEARFRGLPPLIRLVGRDELRDFAGRHAKQTDFYFKHLSISPIVEVHGDTASAVSYIVNVTDSSGPVVRLFGRYLDELRRSDPGVWRIEHRIAEIDSRRETDYSDATLQRMVREIGIPSTPND